jgi:hypothetical protein
VPLHRFSQMVTMSWLDLGRLDGLDDVSRLLSARHLAPARLARRDLFGDPEVPAQLGVLAQGPVFALANLRTWGLCFNPLSLFFALAFAFDEAASGSTPASRRPCTSRPSCRWSSPASSARSPTASWTSA